MKYIVYDSDGKILRTGDCTKEDFLAQAGENEWVKEGEANDVTQKIVGGETVDKTPEEIAADSLPSADVPVEDQRAFISNKEWDALRARVEILETA